MGIFHEKHRFRDIWCLEIRFGCCADAQWLMLCDSIAFLEFSGAKHSPSGRRLAKSGGARRKNTLGVVFDDFLISKIINF